MEWTLEVAKGIGRLLLHPVFYFSMLWVLLAGLWRIKRERKDFHIRVHTMLLELRHLFPAGIVVGLILSIATILLGITLPIKLIIIIAVSTTLLTIVGNARLLSAAFTIGIPILLVSIFSLFSFEWNFLASLDSNYLVGASILLGLLLIAEGALMGKNGLKDVSPKLRTSRRGLTVGALQTKRFWLLPLFVFLPSGVLALPFDWWPVFSPAQDGYSFVLLPFLLGFQQQIQTELPEIAVKRMGKSILLLGTVVLIVGAVCALFIPIYAAMITSVLALIGRIWVASRHRTRENNRPYYFAPRNSGVMVLDVLPHSPADKMGLKTGEIIQNCNKMEVNNQEEMYKALSKNRAYCKLEVFDKNNEIRIVQGALYEGDHHQLGILFIESDEGPQANKAI